MEIIADLHLHSKYSRAVSKKMTITEIARWAKKKGIGLVAAPDWTHPLWLRELKSDLIEVGEGIYGTKTDPQGPKFLLATEISSIYNQGGKTRRIHNLVLASSFEVVGKINQALTSQGANLLSDGRPIIGLSSIELCSLVFSASKDSLVIPCHAWTPWFSLYGSKSGFDSISECFGQFTDRIFAIETGLSSDPAMNWRIGELDTRSIVSFSDAHSPAKLGREVTVFELENLSFKSISEALKPSLSPNRIAYTIEFYPEEGKYHYTGHRKCQVKQTPQETKNLGETCPVCGRQLTVGVMHRVEKLATRSVENLQLMETTIGDEVQAIDRTGRPPYVMLVPLMEILSEALGSGSASQGVLNEYDRLIGNLSSEFTVLLNTPIEEIAKFSGERIAEGVAKVRKGEIVIDPGYDGVFGKVMIWGEKEKPSQKQMSLF